MSRNTLSVSAEKLQLTVMGLTRPMVGLIDVVSSVESLNNGSFGVADPKIGVQRFFEGKWRHAGVE